MGVVLNGKIFAISHAEVDVLKPRLMSKITEGGILFYEDADVGMSSHSENWLIAYENTEVIYFKRSDFMKIWDLHRI